MIGIVDWVGTGISIGYCCFCDVDVIIYGDIHCINFDDC